MALHGIHINPAHKGKFARAVGKKPGEHITSGDIQKGLHSSSATERKEANFARNAKKWHHGKTKAKRTDGDRAAKIYGK